jgi:hypothetical protein
MGTKARAPRPIGDVAVVCGKDENGLHILRRRSEDAPLEAGVAQPLAEGKPIAGEVISMRRREDLPFVFDVTTELAGRDAAPRGEHERQEREDDGAGGDGPAQVATDSYRKGWDAIWGRRRKGGTSRDVN